MQRLVPSCQWLSLGEITEAVYDGGKLIVHTILGSKDAGSPILNNRHSHFDWMKARFGQLRDVGAKEEGRFKLQVH